MVFSPSVIRRYTPPTCTLEIIAKSSPLSRWTNNLLLKDVRFQLHFDDPKLSDQQKITIQGDRHQLDSLVEVVTNYVQDFLQQKSTRSLSFPKTSATALKNRALNVVSDQPSLKPQGLLFHELAFGSLANAESGTEIKLSAVQLFDLANALEEYNTEVAALPEANSNQNRVRIYSWASAAVVILAVGVTLATFKMVNQTPKPTNTVAALKDSTDLAPEVLPELPAVLPPAPPQITSPLPSATLPSDLSNTKTLLPPNRVIAPSTPTTPSQGTTSTTTPVSPKNTPKQSAKESGVAITDQPEKTKTRYTANPNQNSSSSTPERKLTEIPQEQPKIPENAPTLTNTNRSAEVKPNQSQIASEGIDRVNPTELTQLNNASDAAKKPENIATNTNQEQTLFDNLPQVAEVRYYFEQKWQPPNGLQQTLEYSLELKQDGSISRILPRGKASEVYLDRTNMPLIGEPFVSALDNPENPRIRVVLSPDGSVRTFQED